MDFSGVVLLIVGVLLGVTVGAAAAWQVLRSRQDSASARMDADLARLREDLATAQAQASDARAEAAQGRVDQARWQTDVAKAEGQIAEARTDVAEARMEAAEAQAKAAETASQLAAALAERDAAIDRAKQLGEDRDSLVNQFKVLSGDSLEQQRKKAEALAEERQRQTDEKLQPLQELIIRFSDRLAQVEKERVAMSTQLRDQVQMVQNTGEHLRRETSALATALRKPQVRGSWGELQLKRVAEYAGMVERCDFDLQTTTTTTEDRTIRPDMRVNLADGKFIFVDSKVPLSAFLEAYETEDEVTRTAKLQTFGRHVKSHIDQLSSKKYWKADAGTPEFVVLFLPNEQFMFSALEQVPDLHEYAASRDIVIATPNTLIAMLRSVAYGWKQASLAESAAEVSALGLELYDRLITMGGHFDKMGRSLKAAVDSYNKGVGSMETRVLVTARKFRELKVTDRDLASVRPVEEVPRSIAAAELVEDAAQVEPMIGRERRREDQSLSKNDQELALFNDDQDSLDWATSPAKKQQRRAEGA